MKQPDSVVASMRCTADALLMGFRSSSERFHNGTLEKLALTILHL